MNDKRKEISRKRRRDLQLLILAKYTHPHSWSENVLKLSATEIRDELGILDDVRFIGQQMKLLLFTRQPVYFNGDTTYKWIIKYKDD